MIKRELNYKKLKENGKSVKVKLCKAVKKRGKKSQKSPKEEKENTLNELQRNYEKEMLGAMWVSVLVHHSLVLCSETCTNTRI